MTQCTPSTRICVIAAVFAGMGLALFSAFRHAEEQPTYRFERMWPTLQQPWHFFFPSSVAVDHAGNVYVADGVSNRVGKFTSQGQFLAQWGRTGSGPGQFNGPSGVAVDASGNVYVADADNNRVQKLGPDGTPLAQWGSYGIGLGQFHWPSGITVDASGNIYVADAYNSRIQKLGPDGTPLAQWGSYGAARGQFDWPFGMAVDASGNVYVVDANNNRVQKLASNGTPLAQWGSQGAGPGQFDGPRAVAVDASGNIYVAEWWGRVQKLGPDGTPLAQWGGQEGSGPGLFRGPTGVAVDATGAVYVADYWNHQIQKLSPEGTPLAQWGSAGSTPGQLEFPRGVAVDCSGNVYVADTNNDRIQKLSPEGTPLAQWGSPGQFSDPSGVALDTSGNIYVASNQIHKLGPDGAPLAQWGGGGGGSGPGEFNTPCGLAVDAPGNVYVADTGNLRIQKLGPDGTPLAQWGSGGAGPGQFWGPTGVAVDALGCVYVAEFYGYRIQKLGPDGTPLAQWGSEGSGPGQFAQPFGVAVDASGNVYVADTYNHRVQKLGPDGTPLSQWGNAGSGPGQFVECCGIAMDVSGNVYVADSGNHRIQKFRPVAQFENDRAVVVAGGGPFAGNNLWDATQMCANFAYRTLAYQGFAKDSIYYLSAHTRTDLDNNGLGDDMAGTPTKANLEHGLTEWAAGSDDLVVYLVGRGNEDATFCMSELELLTSDELGAWLNAAKSSITGTMTVVYDACYSGSFVQDLSGAGRIVLTSAGADEDAYFLSMGTISFSNFFWTHVFNGLNIAEAFTLASAAVGQTVGFQTPHLEDAGNLASHTFVGNGTVIHGDVPIIGGVSDEQVISCTAAATLWADPVTDDEGISRVWAVIRPPDFATTSPNDPIWELPSAELWPVPGTDRWEGEYAGFTTPGTYTIAFYARDRAGNTSLPVMMSVSVASPLRRRAVLVAGGSETSALWSSIERAAVLAYGALRFQGYSDDDVHFLSPVPMCEGVDGKPVWDNVEYAVTDWAAESTQDVVVYLIGERNGTGFRLGESQTLEPADLDAWLDNLQGVIPGKVTVICDMAGSGDYVSAVTPPEGKQRLLLASTSADRPAFFLGQGDLSFSAFFWRGVLNGATVANAFGHAATAMDFAAKGAQVAQLDDNGNGIGNEKTDGILARNYRLGNGILLAGADPVIGTICPAQMLGGTAIATIWVDDLTPVGVVTRVVAVIMPPGYLAIKCAKDGAELPSIELTAMPEGRYEGTYGGFSTAGMYHGVVYAADEDGNVSIPKTVQIVRALTDVNGDGEVNALDVQLVINAALDIPIAPYDGDVNGDGSTDAVDIQLVINAVMGIQGR